MPLDITEQFLLGQFPTVFQLAQIAAALSSGNVDVSPEDAQLMSKSAYRIWLSAFDEVVRQREQAEYLADEIPKVSFSILKSHSDRFFEIHTALRALPKDGKISWKKACEIFRDEKGDKPGTLLSHCANPIEDLSPEKRGAVDVEKLKHSRLDRKTLLAFCQNISEGVRLATQARMSSLGKKAEKFGRRNPLRQSLLKLALRILPLL